MNARIKVLCGFVGGLLLLQLASSEVRAADAYPVSTDIDQGVANFTAPWAGAFGAYTVNSAASLNGNAVLGITQNAMTACCHGTSVVVAISNGENGDDGSPDLVGGLPNTDIPNATPANSVFSTIGNASGRLEDGNVIRFSAWFRSDPANPITVESQVAPILKIEYWKEALSPSQDTNATQIFPNFGDRLFDQDQQGYAIAQVGGSIDPPSYVDINGDGSVIHDAGFPPQASAANGRLAGLATDHWTLATATHTVNAAEFFGIGTAGYGAGDVTRIESIQGVMFVGEFSTTAVAGPGTLLVDNLLIEVFKNAASVTAINNPDPSLSEVTGLPGDFNNNMVVDAADYTVWRNNLGAAEGSLLNGNGNGGTVDETDYALWKMHFGETPPGSGGVASVVPEPATLMLAVITLLGSWTLKRSHRFTR
jgi:hypothetical protein